MRAGKSTCSALWRASVVTGVDGKATVEVVCPDNLTTWRVTARAATRDTKVGQTTAKFLVRKDLLVRPGGHSVARR